mmetsp:Transcript_16899/g.25998  ORF Transcript_16899/g.25998 Transcript_16899/m.25998 type:complete len:80 (-) Transcript_16899:2263-2502(-)
MSREIFNPRKKYGTSPEKKVDSNFNFNDNFRLPKFDKNQINQEAFKNIGSGLASADPASLPSKLIGHTPQEQVEIMVSK